MKRLNGIGIGAICMLVGATVQAQTIDKLPAGEGALTPVKVSPRDPGLYRSYTDFFPASGNDVVVTLNNIPSRDPQGAACNTRISVAASLQNPRWHALGWNVQLTANAPSWQSDIAVLITNVHGEGYILRPAVEVNEPGAGSYASSGVVGLCDAYHLPPIPLPDGRLYLEFYEVFDNAPNCADDGVWNSGQLTFRFASAPAFNGHTEGGDAGSLPETAQATPAGALPAIRGTLSPDDVDLYAIYIANPAQFRATTRCLTSFDTQLYLFDAAGRGVAFNDDSPEGGLQSLLTGQCIRQPGIYYLAITGFGRRPVGCGGGDLWAQQPYNQIRCPDGAEPDSRVREWVGMHGVNGAYLIELQGARGAAPVSLEGCSPAQQWDEYVNGGADAGDLPASAQLVASANTTPCATPVQAITGELLPDDVDMYVICVTNPAAFVASTVDTTGWDTQLWLFRCDGAGVMHNDDHHTTTESRLDNSLNCITEPGTYLLAISGYPRAAVDAQGNPLWASGSLQCASHTRRIAGWIGNSFESGRYRITLSGAAFVSRQGCTRCSGDTNSDRIVDDADLLIILFNFGSQNRDADLNQDGVVDDADLLLVLFNFGSSC